MKIIDLIALQTKYGDIKIGEVIAKQNRPFICPKCEGVGSESKLVREGIYGYTDSEYKTIDCNICDGYGYTQRQMKPKIKTEIIGYE